MKKPIKLAMIILIIEAILFFYPISIVKIEKTNKNIYYSYKKDIEKHTNKYDIEYTNNTNYNEHYEEEIRHISKIENRKEWFIKYKNIQYKYKDLIEKDIFTIYDHFTVDELEMLFKVVQAEIGIGTFENKLNVVSVIFNRYYIEKESNDVSLIDILRKNSNGVYQFSVVSNSNYKLVEVDEDSILACEYVFCLGITTEALWFNTKGLNSWASQNREFVMSDEYHNFYK